MTSDRFWQQNFNTDAAKENPTVMELLLSDQHFQLLRKLPNPNGSKLSNAKQVRTSTEHNYAKKEKSVNQLKRGSNRDLQFDFDSCTPCIPHAKQVTSEHNYVKQDKNYKQLKRGSEGMYSYCNPAHLGILMLNKSRLNIIMSQKKKITIS